MTHDPETAQVAVRPQVNLTDPLTDLDGAFRVAQLLAQSSMVPQALRGSPQNCLVTMLLGRELGLSWIQAIRGIYVLPSGQPGLRGSLLLARMRQAGHRYTILHGDDGCICIITRKDEDFKVKYEGTFTLEDAKAAGLVHEREGKLVARSRNGEPLPWEQYRRDMLQWRAVARAASYAVPELVFGFDVAGTGDGDEPEPAPAAPVLPSPAPASDPDEIRRQLEQLGQQTQVFHDTPQEAAPQHEGPPTQQSLVTAFGECGYRGVKAVRAASVLARRDIRRIDQLTPAEAIMVDAALQQILRSVLTEAARMAALEELLDRERQAWGDEQPAESQEQE